jgi:hypothetical protein
MRIEVLMSPDCGHGPRAVALVEEVLREGGYAGAVEEILVATAEQAERWAFPGSPTVRVNGADVDPATRAAVGLG